MSEAEKTTIVVPSSMARKERQEVVAQATTPLEMIASAVQRGMDPATIQQLMDLKDRHEADEARKAYVRAMAAFKSEPLRVGKGKHVRFQTSKGVTEYDHATLAQVVDAVVSALSKHGLSHRWETNQADKAITVSCILTHELGHSERTTLSAGADESGGKNSIQAIGSTVTYLQRYTLMAATGLAAHDMDDDGNSAGKPVEYITESELADLNALAEEVGADIEAFCRYLKIESLDQLPKSWMEKAVKMLEQKRRASK